MLALVASSSIQAQLSVDTLNNIEEVVVTGTLTERKQATLPVPTQVITGESIKKSGLSRLDEIIQEQTGLMTVPDFGGGIGIQVQGLDAAYVMILVDGQPLIGRSAGTLDLSRITVNNIERIEVVKGASSSLYGSEALAGVVNIITKAPGTQQEPRFHVDAKLGSYNTHDASVGFSMGGKKVGFELFGNYYSTDGYNLTDNDYLQTVEPYRNFTIVPQLKVDFSDKLSLTAKARLYYNKQDYKTQIGDENYAGEVNTDDTSYSLQLTHKASDKLKLVYNLYAAHYKSHQYLDDTQGVLFEEDDYNQWFFRPQARATYKINKSHVLTVGVGLNKEILDRTLFGEEAKLQSEFLFGQYEWFINKKWNVLAGFRFDNHHEYKSQFSPKLGVNYRWNKNLSLKASVGYGYKAPDLRQLFLDFSNSTIGYTVLGYNVAEKRLDELENQGQLLFRNDVSFAQPLKPEKSLNVNLGGYYQKDRWTLRYNLFYNDITNLIDTQAVAQKTNGQNVFSYFNLDKIFTYGAEISTSFRLNQNLKFSAGYQYLVAKDKSVITRLKNGEIFARDPETLESYKLSEKDYVGLLNRSKHMANVKVDYTLPSIGTHFSLRVFYRGRYGLFDSNDNAILDRYDNFVKAHFLTNLAATKDFSNGLSVQIGANNLFNYTDKANITNLPGIRLFGRVSYHF